MKTPNPDSFFAAPVPRTLPDRPFAKGMTLLELTVVIVVILSMISILFVGASAWKKGSDRTLCIINIRNVQQGMRAYSNLYGLSTGASVTDLKREVIGLGRYVESEPECPSAGTYAFGGNLGVNVIPNYGELYMECDKKTSEEHLPNDISNW